MHNIDNCMLNSTMEQIKKNWLVIVINTFIAALLVFLTASLSNKYADAREFRQTINSKVDIVEYERNNTEIHGLIKEVNTRVDDMETKQAEYLQIVNDIKNIVTETKTDVKWISLWREEQVRKNKKE